MALILIVDDSPSQILNQKKILEKNGHQVITAENGQTGITMAKERNPDLILMDVVMPDLNGFQATREISKNETTAHIPIIIVTTKDKETDMMWAKRQGAKAYLVKPVKEKELVNAVNELLSEIKK